VSLKNYLESIVNVDDADMTDAGMQGVPGMSIHCRHIVESGELPGGGHPSVVCGASDPETPLGAS